MTHDRRGATAVTVAIAMGVVFALVALVVDLGMARVAQAQLQAATDVAALAGALNLDGTAGGVASARDAVVEVASANVVFGDPVTVDPADVTFGRWTPATATFSAESDPAAIDAVWVSARRSDLRTWFAVVLGREQLATSARSVATRGLPLGAGEVPWYLPFALPDCVMAEHPGETLADITFVLSPAGADTVGWGAVETTPNAAWARDHITAILDCLHEWTETGTVDAACASVSAGDSVNLGNGAQSSSLHALSDAMPDGVPWATDRWGTLPPRHAKSTVSPPSYGTVIEGPIPVFTGTSRYCTAGAAWNETFPVRGFVWGVIYDVAWKGKAAEQNVWVRLDVSHIYPLGEAPGGEDWGVTAPGPPRLVL